MLYFIENNGHCVTCKEKLDRQVFESFIMYNLNKNITM